LTPSLQPGHIVVMDNLSAHTGPKVQQAIEAKECQLLFLPNIAGDQDRTFLENAPMSPADKEKIAYGNAEKVLELARS
jgi:predicted TIM-barrel fold metal-dependent hydrolase